MKAQASRHMVRGKKVKTGVNPLMGTGTKCVEAPRDTISAPLKGVGPTGRFANGDVQCVGWGDRIDTSVCTVRGIRHPEKCAGVKCPANL